MASAHDVAAYILSRQGGMTAMKLQKLVHYSQAWSVVWDERPLFGERLEAWANGPVVRDPKAERKPRITPESDRDRRPVRLVERMDFDGPWCWKKMDAEALHRVHERLSAFERMPFREIEGKQNHQIPVERLGKEARLGPEGSERNLPPVVGPRAQRLSHEHRRQLNRDRDRDFRGMA